MYQYYKDSIWTNHALERLGHRGLSQDIAYQTFKHPDFFKKGKAAGTLECHRKFNNSSVVVICKQNEKKEWIILSCWANPPIYGSSEYKNKQLDKELKSAGFWKGLWLELKRQLGG